MYICCKITSMTKINVYLKKKFFTPQAIWGRAIQKIFQNTLTSAFEVNSVASVNCFFEPTALFEVGIYSVPFNQKEIVTFAQHF